MKKIILLATVLMLTACGEQSENLGAAIDASREGVALIKESKSEPGEGEELSDEKREELLAEGRGELTKAKKLYQQLLDDEPNNGLYHNNYGWVLMNLGEYEGAKKHFMLASQNEATLPQKSAPIENLKLLEGLQSD